MAGRKRREVKVDTGYRKRGNSSSGADAGVLARAQARLHQKRRDLGVVNSAPVPRKLQRQKPQNHAGATISDESWR